MPSLGSTTKKVRIRFCKYGWETKVMLVQTFRLTTFVADASELQYTSLGN
jgi:hypothetical protein